MSDHQDRANNSVTGPAGASLGVLIAETLDTLAAYLVASSLSPRAIHMARRDAKKLRGLALLVPEPLNILGARTGDCVNHARRALGGARDADVRQEMLERIRHLLGEHHAELVAALERDPHARPTQGSLSAEHKALAGLAGEWRAADTNAMQSSAIIAAAASGYRRARKRAAKTGDGETRALHRLRSAIVDHQNQLDFLLQFVPGLKAYATSAHELRKQLGNINDLDMTCAHLTPLILPGSALAALQGAALAQRQKYLEKARALMAQVLDMRASDWEHDVRQSFDQAI